MKEIALVPFVVVLAACASHAPKTTAASSTAPISRSVTDPSGIRLAEQIREYRFGRYVDPGDPLVMHDAHPVYRVEQTAAWNLRPNSKTQSSRSSPAPPSAGSTQRDAELAELNKQRAATRAFHRASRHPESEACRTHQSCRPNTGSREAERAAQTGDGFPPRAP